MPSRVFRVFVGIVALGTISVGTLWPTNDGEASGNNPVELLDAVLSEASDRSELPEHLLNILTGYLIDNIAEHTGETGDGVRERLGIEALSSDQALIVVVSLAYYSELVDDDLVNLMSKFFIESYIVPVTGETSEQVSARLRAAMDTPTASPTPLPGSHEAIEGLPWLADGRTKWEDRAVWNLTSISSMDIESAALMLSFPWIVDGITPDDSSAVSSIRGIMDEEVELARAILGLEWVAGDMKTAESYALSDLRDLAWTDTVLTWQIIGQPFMGPPFRQRDEYALRALVSMSRSKGDLLSDIVGQPWFQRWCGTTWKPRSCTLSLSASETSGRPSSMSTMSHRRPWNFRFPKIWRLSSSGTRRSRPTTILSPRWNRASRLWKSSWVFRFRLVT